MHTNCRKVDGQTSMEIDATFDGFDELGDVGMAGVEAGVGVDDAYDGSRKSVFAVAGGFYEGFAKEEREVGVAVGGEALTESSF